MMADGFDAVKADKMRKLKRTLAWKKLRSHFLLCCFLTILCMTMLWVCFNLEVKLPAEPAVLLVKIWRFCSSQLFLFMLINVIVIVLVFMSGCLRPSNGVHEDLYDEFVRRSQAARKDYVPIPVVNQETAANSEAEKVIQISGPRNLQTAKSFSGTRRPRGQKLKRSESADIKQIKEKGEEKEEATVSNSLIVMEVPSTEEAMPAEELQRRSDEFIAKFNKHIRQERLENSG